MEPGREALVKRLLKSLIPTNGNMLNESLKAVTGMGYDDLSTQGRKQYPGMAPGTAHHRLASKLAAGAIMDKVGWIPGVGEGLATAIPQLAGLGIEASEAAGRMAGGVPGAGPVEHFQMPDTLRDLSANTQGIQEAIEAYRLRNRPAARPADPLPTAARWP